MKKNKVLSGIMAGAIALSMCPVGALAADPLETTTSTPVNLTAKSGTVVEEYGADGKIDMTLPTAIPLVADDLGAITSGTLTITNRSYKVTQNGQNWATPVAEQVNVKGIKVRKVADNLTFDDATVAMKTADSLALALNGADGVRYSFATMVTTPQTPTAWTIQEGTVASGTDGTGWTATGATLEEAVVAKGANPKFSSAGTSTFTVTGTAGALSADYADETIGYVDWTFQAPDISKA